MLSRRAIFMLSLLISALVYLAVLALAPHVTLMAANRDIPPELLRFKVRIHPPEPQPETNKPEPQVQESTPEAIRERLAELFGSGDTTAPVAEGTSSPEQLLETADLAARLMQSMPDRLHDLTSPAELLQRADTRIVEIAGDTARQELDIARRLVRPSPDYILPPDQMPAFRSDALDAGQIPLEGDFRGTVRLGEALNPSDTSAPGPPLPPPPPPPPPPQTAQKLDIPIPEQEPLKTAEKIQKEMDYEFLDDLVDIQISILKDKNENKGYFEIQVSIKKNASLKILPKDITFVLDASSSITQRKLDLNVRAVSRVLNLLRLEDRFNIVVFRDNPVFFSPNRRPATPEAIAEAQKFIKGIQSIGQTDVFAALSAVITDPPRTGIPGLIFVLTDGQPTTGLQDTRAIINQVSDNNRSGNTLFPFGSGNRVNQYLMDLLAYRNRGKSMVEPSIDRTDDSFLRFFEDLLDPVLVNIRTDYSRTGASEIYPSAMPDFYLKWPVKVYGRFDPDKEKELVMRISGRALDRQKELIFKARLDNAPAADPEVRKRWAFAKAYHIISEIARSGERPELLQTLRELRDQYGVKTVYSQ